MTGDKMAGLLVFGGRLFIFPYAGKVTARKSWQGTTKMPENSGQ
jgi:hypothetical protein